MSSSSSSSAPAAGAVPVKPVALGDRDANGNLRDDAVDDVTTAWRGRSFQEKGKAVMHPSPPSVKANYGAMRSTHPPHRDSLHTDGARRQQRHKLRKQQSADSACALHSPRTPHESGSEDEKERETDGLLSGLGGLLGRHEEETTIDVEDGVDPNMNPVEVFAAGGSPGAAKKPSHQHFSQRAPTLRAAVLGANDGLVSVASLMLGVAAAQPGLNGDSFNIMLVSGVSGWVAGALSMACGEYVSVASQKDAELCDVEREKAEFLKGPQHRLNEMRELEQIYLDRGISPELAKQLVLDIHANLDGDIDKVVAVHVRDELAIDTDQYADPVTASVVSALSFTAGALLPLVSGLALRFMGREMMMIGMAVVSSFGLACFGAIGAMLGGAPVLRGALRVLIGGWISMAGTFGVGLLFDTLGEDA
ncbi:hypothetical protein HK101_000316 [Irineochytrium annulatum]|nr:hypothetical protein HK101_000316 [Irineochytrium annulatum]